MTGPGTSDARHGDSPAVAPESAPARRVIQRETWLFGGLVFLLAGASCHVSLAFDQAQSRQSLYERWFEQGFTQDPTGAVITAAIMDYLVTKAGDAGALEKNQARIEGIDEILCATSRDFENKVVTGPRFEWDGASTKLSYEHSAFIPSMGQQGRCAAGWTATVSAQLIAFSNGVISDFRDFSPDPVELSDRAYGGRLKRKIEQVDQDRAPALRQSLAWQLLSPRQIYAATEGREVLMYPAFNRDLVGALKAAERIWWRSAFDDEESAPGAGRCREENGDYECGLTGVYYDFTSRLAMRTAWVKSKKSRTAFFIDLYIPFAPTSSMFFGVLSASIYRESPASILILSVVSLVSGLGAGLLFTSATRRVLDSSTATEQQRRILLEEAQQKRKEDEQTRRKQQDQERQRRLELIGAVGSVVRYVQDAIEDYDGLQQGRYTRSFSNAEEVLGAWRDYASTASGRSAVLIVSYHFLQPFAARCTGADNAKEVAETIFNRLGIDRHLKPSPTILFADESEQEDLMARQELVTELGKLIPDRLPQHTVIALAIAPAPVRDSADIVVGYVDDIMILKKFSVEGVGFRARRDFPGRYTVDFYWKAEDFEAIRQEVRTLSRSTGKIDAIL